MCWGNDSDGQSSPPKGFRVVQQRSKAVPEGLGRIGKRLGAEEAAKLVVFTGTGLTAAAQKQELTAAQKEDLEEAEFFLRYHDHQLSRRFPRNLTNEEPAAAFREACALGHEASCKRLKRLERILEGIKAEDNRDYTEAHKLFLTSCKEGSAYSCYRVGRFYTMGEGAEQSDAKGLEWWRKACQMGYKRACSSTR